MTLMPGDGICLPSQPLTIRGTEGCETYAIDEHTIGIRPKWLPYPENKPNVNKKYLVSSDSDVELLEWYNDVWFPWGDNDTQVFIENITAFMELPKPYEGK